MSKRTSATVANGAASKDDRQSSPPSMSTISPSQRQRRSVERKEENPPLTPAAVTDKQKVLLSTDAGHFSLIRALHLADLITELNGE